MCLKNLKVGWNLRGLKATETLKKEKKIRETKIKQVLEAKPMLKISQCLVMDGYPVCDYSLFFLLIADWIRSIFSKKRR